MLDTVELQPVATVIATREDEAWYDAGAADAAVAFFHHYLKLTKDKWAGQPFRLEPWQSDHIVRPLFGWKRANGTRRYRRCIVFVPRKNGKTELAAGISLLLLLGDGVFGPEVYAIAKDKEQAKIVFDKAAAMVNMSAELRKHLTVFKNAIFSQELQGAIKPLTGNAEGKHGLNASGVIGDELHEWPDGRLYTTVHQSEAAREQPVEFLISTAGVRGKGFGWEVWEEAFKILDGTQPEPDTLVVIYAAEAGDDWTDEATWAKANPNLGVSVSIDYLRAECRKAKSNPRLENDFRRYHLNQWTNQAVRWIPLEAWDRCARRDWRDETALTGRPCFAGVDLSSNRDITAVVYVFPPIAAGGTFDVVARYFVPTDTIVDRVRTDRVPYDLWVRQGAMVATEGNTTDYEFVIATIVKDGSTFDIQGLGVDRWNSSHFTTRLADQGFDAGKISLVGQGYASLSEPSKQLERLIFGARLDHAAQPVTRWMAENVAVTTDPAGNIKPAKDKSSEKIDGIAALIDALFVHLNLTVEGPSVYETRGILEIEF
ncbi:terminase large subunit [Lichenihabitans psoromatis]|uniref:terminase large subunit n=1 Tax=Lichenihabitans psoromatis TaxID=2528642 RepID=UPI001038419D|nr:terminase TerL endonuclease subunit [Lichenihabitans psoromatis]